MNKDEQLDFVDQLINNVRDDIKDWINGNTDESWDGVELRQFIADSFNACVMKEMMSRKRRIAYNNHLYCTPV